MSTLKSISHNMILLGIFAMASCRTVLPSTSNVPMLDIYADSMTKMSGFSNINFSISSEIQVEQQANNNMPDYILDSKGFQHANDCHFQWRYSAKAGHLSLNPNGNEIDYRTSIPYFGQIRATLAGCCSVQNTDCSYATDICKGNGTISMDGNCFLNFDNNVRIKITNIPGTFTASGKCDNWINDFCRGMATDAVNKIISKLEVQLNGTNYNDAISEIIAIVNDPVSPDPGDFKFNLNISRYTLPKINFRRKYSFSDNLAVQTVFMGQPFYTSRGNDILPPNGVLSTMPVGATDTIKFYTPDLYALGDIEELLNKNIRGLYKYGKCFYKHYLIDSLKISGYERNKLFFMIFFKGPLLKGEVSLIATTEYEDNSENVFFSGVVVDSNSLINLKNRKPIVSFREIAQKIKDQFLLSNSNKLHKSMEGIQTYFVNLNDYKNVHVLFKNFAVPGHKILFSDGKLYCLRSSALLIDLKSNL